jgi:hypothetical protein
MPMAGRAAAERPESDGITGFCEIVGRCCDYHRRGDPRRGRARRTALGEVQHERVDAARSDECREGEDAGLPEHRFDPAR